MDKGLVVKAKMVERKRWFMNLELQEGRKKNLEK